MAQDLVVGGETYEGVERVAATNTEGEVIVYPENGDTVSNAVQYVIQSLADDEKAQARKNIDALANDAISFAYKAYTYNGQTEHINTVVITVKKVVDGEEVEESVELNATTLYEHVKLHGYEGELTEFYDALAKNMQTLKGDGLELDPDENILYLTSNGERIGTGVGLPSGVMDGTGNQVWLMDAEGTTYQGDICSYDKLHAYGSSTSASYDDVKIGDRVICEQDGAVLTVTAKSENYAGLSFIQYYLDGYTSGGADLSALAWVPTIEYTNTGFGSLTESLDISTFNGYMGAHLEGLTYEDLNGVSEIYLAMTRRGDAGHPAGGNGEKVACSVTHEDEWYFVGNKSLVSTGSEDTGEAFAIAVDKDGLTIIRVTEEWYGEYIVYGSYGKPTWNQMPNEFLSDEAQAALNPSSITIEGAMESATVGQIYTAVETGSTVFWKNTTDSRTYRVLDVYRDIMDGWHQILLARAWGQDNGLYFLYYNYGYGGLRLVPIYAPSVGVRFIHGTTEKLFFVNADGQAVITDVASGEVTELATTILTSPSGNKFQITVDDNGNLTAAAVE